MPWTTYEYVYCGKHCTGCPHGPYRYDWKYVAGRKRKVYAGAAAPKKRAPGHAHQPRKIGPPEAAGGNMPHPHDAILSRRAANPRLALEILGLTTLPSPSNLRTTHRRLAALHHPDRGGDPKTFARITAAATYLRPHCAAVTDRAP